LIRPAERDDVPAVADLFERTLGQGRPPPPGGTAAFLERTLFQSPWSDPEIPSLAYVARKGRLAGFVGTQVRRMRLDSRPVRVVASSHLMVEPDEPAPAGALLLGRLLGGAQLATVTDTATGVVRRMWEGLGGQALSSCEVDWIRLLSPLRFAGRRYGVAVGSLADETSSSLDRLGSRVARRIVAPPRSAASAEPLDAETVFEHLPVVTEGLRLVPERDGAYLDWLFAELHRPSTRGVLSAALVREAGGEPAGWYIGRVAPGGVVHVAELAARPGRLQVVTDRLLADAEAGGAVAVRGRADPGVLQALRGRHCLLRYSGRTLIHSDAPEVIGTVAAGSALLSELQGEMPGLP